MPTTFANSINSNPIYAERAEKDAAGNTISTTYATKSELPSGVPSVTSSDDGKVLTADYTGGVASYSWETPSAGGGDIVFVTLDTGMSSAEAETLFHTISAAVSGGKRVIGVRESLTPPVTRYYQYPLMWLSDNSNVYESRAIFTAVYYDTGSSSFQMESYAVGNLHMYNEYVVEFANSNGGTGQH